MARTNYKRDFADQITLSETSIQNYWNKVDVGEINECWLWTAAKCKSGYGAFHIDRVQHVATHVALILAGKPRPAPPHNLALHGECSNPTCVNPRHLRWGTVQENADDESRRGRRPDLRGERCGRAKLTADLVRMIRASPKTGVALARELGVSRATISIVRNRIVWTHVD